jgi:chloramphenicol-sensitive protein RarD
MLFLREKLNLLKSIAISLAMAGVFYLTIDYGRFPWISVGLALSFGFYGLSKKSFGLDPVNSIMMETMFLSLLGILYIIFLNVNGNGHFGGMSFRTDIFLVLSGFVTVVPLFLFANGANKIPLASVGFLQYLTPSLMLMIGVIKYGEDLTQTYLVSLLFIWTGLAIYSVHLLRSGYRTYNRHRKRKR